MTAGGCGHTLMRGWLFGYPRISWYCPECKVGWAPIPNVPGVPPSESLLAPHVMAGKEADDE